MYAVIKTGGKQYRVQPGDTIVVEKIDAEPGANVSFAEVLMLGSDKGVTVGAPVVDGATVAATLIETRKGEKVKIFKKIRRQGYRRTRGHRQLESVLRITGIEGAGEKAKWVGEVSLITKAEINARARGLAPRVEAPAEAEAPVKKAPAARRPPPRPKPLPLATKLNSDAFSVEIEEHTHGSQEVWRFVAQRPRFRGQAPWREEVRR